MVARDESLIAQLRQPRPEAGAVIVLRSETVFTSLRDDDIMQVICPTCQAVSEKPQAVTPGAGYFAWGCFRYFG